MIKEKMELYQQLYHKNKEIEKELEQDNIERVAELFKKKEEIIASLNGFNPVQEIEDDELLDALEGLLKKIKVLEDENIKVMEEKKIDLAKQLAKIKQGKKRQDSYFGKGSQNSGGRIIDRKR